MKNRAINIFALLLCFGCSESHTACGDGDELGYSGATYCVYRAGLFEECPNAFPNQYDFGEFQACGEMEDPPDGLEEEVENKFHDGGIDASGIDASGPTGDGGSLPREDARLPSINSCEYHGLRYESGDELCDIKGCNSCKCNPEPDVEGVGCQAALCLPGYTPEHPDYDSEDLRPNLDKGVCARKQWHLSSQDEAISLAVFWDGTFRWIAAGCDSSRNGAGRWRRSGADAYLEFVPEIGSAGFAWPDGAHYDSLVVEDDPGISDGSLAVRVGESAEEVWAVGGVCPRCEGDGPMSIDPCSNPFAF